MLSLTDLDRLADDEYFAVDTLVEVVYGAAGGGGKDDIKSQLEKYVDKEHHFSIQHKQNEQVRIV